jgi:hypothetical protein
MRRDDEVVGRLQARPALSGSGPAEPKHPIRLVVGGPRCCFWDGVELPGRRKSGRIVVCEGADPGAARAVCWPGPRRRGQTRPDCGFARRERSAYGCRLEAEIDTAAE